MVLGNLKLSGNTLLLGCLCIAAWYITGVDYDLSSLSHLYSMWKKLLSLHNHIDL